MVGGTPHAAGGHLVEISRAGRKIWPKDRKGWCRHQQWRQQGVGGQIFKRGAMSTVLQSKRRGRGGRGGGHGGGRTGDERRGGDVSTTTATTLRWKPRHWQEEEGKDEREGGGKGNTKRQR